MSTLRQSLSALGTRPEPWLALAVLAWIGFAVDLGRAPQDQLSSRVAVSFIHAYQALGRPITRTFIRCRYRPSCSEYAELAVTRFGVVRGGAMAFARLRSCQTSVPLGTADPVPEGPR